jgi:hypothetical protein
LTTDSLVAQLRAVYNDTESADRASRKLNMIHQGKRPFPVFLAGFNCRILDTGGATWVDQVKKTFLSDCLSPELKAVLVANPVPARYHDYSMLLHTVGVKLKALEKD